MASRCPSKKALILLALALFITFGYFTHINMKVNSTSIPQHGRVVEKKQQPFNSEVANRYKKNLRPFTPGLDKNCVLTLQNKFIGKGDMPIIIPSESEMKSISLDVIACLYHRYVTTLQIQCSSIDRVGEIQRNGWYICTDPAYIPRKPCKTFLSNSIFPENIFSEDLKSRYGCDLYSTPLWLNKSLKSWKNETNIAFDGAIDILTLTVHGLSNLPLIDRFINDDSKGQVRQLLLELHFDSSQMRIEDYTQVLLRLHELHKSGLRIMWFERIFQCATSKFNKCYGIYFLQENLKDKSKTIEVVDLPSVEEIKRMKSTERSNLYFKYLQRTQIFCQNILRMGGIIDGGWDVCHDHMLKYSHPCIVYSFGVSGDLTFDDEVSETYHCNVFSFDPTTVFPTHQHGLNVWFYQIGLGNKHNKFKAGYVAPLQELRKMLNHTSSPIAILKIDIEGAEWPSLPNMIDTNQLEDVAQMYLEFHGIGDKENQLVVLKKLYDAGFRIFWFHPNPNCLYNKKIRTRSQCMEVYFLNINFKKKN